MSHINVHFLEIFYYVARYGSITEAMARIPYGIGRSAISAQIKALEQQVGFQLLYRKPMSLTPGGRQMMDFIEHFFGDMDSRAAEIREGTVDLIRLASSRAVLSHALLGILKQLRRTFPKIRLTLRNGSRGEINQWFAAQEIDLAVTILEGSAPAGCVAESLLHLPIQLLVPRRSGLKAASELWRRPRQTETLLCPDTNDAIRRAFNDGLEKHGVHWPLVMEVASVDVIESYVEGGFGIGLTVAVPGRKPPRSLRVLPLPDFPKLNVGLLWRRQPNRPTKALIELLRARASE